MDHVIGSVVVIITVVAVVDNEFIEFVLLLYFVNSRPDTKYAETVYGGD